MKSKEVIISIFQCFPGRRLLPLHFLQSQILETNCLWTRILPNCWALSEVQTTPTKILPSLYSELLKLFYVFAQVLENEISYYHLSNDAPLATSCDILFLRRLTLYGFNFNRSGPLSTALVKTLNKKYGYCFPVADWGLITNNYESRHTTSVLFIRSYALNIHEDLFL